MSSEHTELRLLQEWDEKVTDYMEALGWQLVEINGREMWQHIESGVTISTETAEGHYLHCSEPPPF